MSGKELVARIGACGNGNRKRAGQPQTMTSGYEISRLLGNDRRYVQRFGGTMNSPGYGYRVMIVEDDPIAVEVARLLLTIRGMTVIAAAGNGAEATRELDQSGKWLDLILIDLNLPDFDGLEFLRQLRDRNHAAKIIIVSGAIESVRQTAEMLCTPYGLDLLGRIDKPLTASKLDTCLARLAASNGLPGRAV